MMKTIQWIIMMGGIFYLAGCASPRVLVLSTPAVSMTETSFESGEKFTSAGPVETKYCEGNKSTVNKKGDSNVGFMDEVIHKAQKEKDARYIADAQFFLQGDCMVLEGTAMK